MKTHSWLHRHGWAICLAVIVTTGTLRSLQWVFLVPIYQSPDEPAHLDYALWLAGHGDLTHVRGRPATMPPVVYTGRYVVHPHSVYLLERTRAADLWWHRDRTVDPAYGTRVYFQQLADNAPRDLSSPRDRLPAMLPLYPLGYYALLAGWLTMLDRCGASIVVLFFGARILSVVLLAVSLTLIYATARELHLAKAMSLFLTACIALFPLTSFISSYVQPDNLTLLLVSLCFYLTLCARRRCLSAGTLAALGLALAALLLTKLHTFLCVAIPSLACVATVMMSLPRPERRWLRAACCLILPATLAFVLHLWVSQGTTGKVVAADVNLFRGVQRALVDFYSAGTHRSFWGHFGWVDTRIRIVSPEVSIFLRTPLRLVTWLVLALGLTRLIQVTCRLSCVARNGRTGLALRMAMANVPMNSFLLFTLMMILLHVITNNFFRAQGRNWFPMLMPMFMLGLVHAPKALPRGPTRRHLAIALAAGLALYCLVAGHYAVGTIERRYYAPIAEPPTGQ